MRASNGVLQLQPYVYMYMYVASRRCMHRQTASRTLTDYVAWPSWHGVMGVALWLFDSTTPKLLQVDTVRS